MKKIVMEKIVENVEKGNRTKHKVVKRRPTTTNKQGVKREKETVFQK